MLQACGGTVPPNTDHVWFKTPRNPSMTLLTFILRPSVYRFRRGGKMSATKKVKIGS